MKIGFSYTETIRVPNYYQPCALVTLPQPTITRPDCALLPTPSHVGWWTFLMLLLHVACLYPLYSLKPAKVPLRADTTPIDITFAAAPIATAPAMPKPSQPAVVRPIAPKPTPIFAKSKPISTTPPKSKTEVKSVPKPVPMQKVQQFAAQTAQNPVQQTTTPITNTSSAVLAPHRVQHTPPAAPVIAPLRAAIFDADYLHNPKPAYPKSAARRGIEGTVILSVLVSPEGRATSINLVQSSGDDDLDDAARIAVEQWRFVPAKRADTSVASSVRVPIRFSLEN